MYVTLLQKETLYTTFCYQELAPKCVHVCGGRCLCPESDSPAQGLAAGAGDAMISLSPPSQSALMIRGRALN